MTKAAPRAKKVATGGKKKPRAVAEKGQGTRKSAIVAAERKRLFIEAYIANGGRGDLAAISAGYVAHSARRQAVRLLAMPDVREALRERQDRLAKKHELTTESVIAELSKIVHADPRKIFDKDGRMLHPRDWPEEMAGTLASIEVDEVLIGRRVKCVTKKVKFWSKDSAIDKAMKHLGLFEKDNKQKTDPLVELLARVSGSALKPVEE